VKVNLGCSTKLLQGYLNVDTWVPLPQLNGDLADCEFKRVDLRRMWPWKDESVEELRAYDIIEHLPDKIHTMNEAWRVLKPGGMFDIIVPTTDGRGAWQDPTHVSFWNRNSFWYHEVGNLHYKRFKDSSGIKGAFMVVSEETKGPDENQIVKLHIVLGKVA
jgi:predicted SAM-dependent methyltransferase